jgi:hypothetical protein
VQSNSFDLAYIIGKGAPFACGQPADKRRNQPDVSCHIEATITVKSAVASFLGLSSRTIASGVAGNVVDHLTDDNGDDLGRAYFLPLSAAVRAKLRAKHVRALGVHVTGTVSAHTTATAYSPASDKVTCGSDPNPTDSCHITAPKRVTWPAGDGELVCWRLMPWYLATPATYGKMCPRPRQI